MTRARLRATAAPADARRAQIGLDDSSDAAGSSATARVDCRLGCAAEQRGEGLAARVRGGGG